jgi:hypothetical protein
LDNALEEWSGLTSRSPLDFNLLRFLRDEIALHPREVGAWQSTLSDLLNLSLRNGMPLSSPGDEPPRTAAARQRNADEALLAAVNACARVTRQRTKPAWQGPTGAGDYIGILRQQRKWDLYGVPELAVSLDCLSFLDLQGQDLSAQDLAGGCLADSCLDDASFLYTALSNTDLSRSSLRRCHFFGAICFRARFVETDLRDASMRKADLREADLTRAEISRADLSGAQLSGVRR